MQQLNTIWSIASLDYKQKIRQKATLATLIFLMLFTFFCFPAKETSQSYSIALGNSSSNISARGYYNSDWIGMLIIVYFGFILTLFGVYLIRKTLRRDQQTGYGELMVTSPISKALFFEGKRLSNFLYLSTLLLFVEVLGVFIQLLRQEVVQINFLSYILPFLFVIMPFLYLLSTVAIIFEVVPILKKNFGNSVVFILGIAMFSLSMVNLETNNNTQNLFTRLADVSGVAYILDQVKESFMSVYGQQQMSYSIFGPSAPYTDFFTFQFHWDRDFVMSRFLLVGLSFGLLYVIQVLVPVRSLFIPKKRRIMKDRKNSQDTSSADILLTNNGVTHLLEPVAFEKVSLFRLFYFQLLILVRDQKKIIILLFVACITQWLPIDTNIMQFIWFIITILPIFFWSQIGQVREEDYLKTTMAYPRKIIWSDLLSHSLLWLCYFSGSIARSLITGNIIGAITLVLSVIVIVSIAYLCNYFTKSELLFEVLFLCVWYIDLVQQAHFINLFNPVSHSIYSLIGLTVCIVISLCLIFSRKGR